MDTVVLLSGTTRGDTLENLGRSLGRDFVSHGIKFIELSMRDEAHLIESIKLVNFEQVKLIFSWASMGMGLTVRRENGTYFDLWHELRIPFVTFHGDSPAYFFDRHVVKDSKFITLYGFAEHCELRKRLPLVRGPIDSCWPIIADDTPVDSLDLEAKRNGKILFLKNGKDPNELRRLWTNTLEPFPLQIIFELASYLENHLDECAGNQIDDLITKYFINCGYDLDHLLKLRLFLIAQLDDYIRAVKCTRMIEALLDLPVEIRGNNWSHVDFTGKKATYIDECDYVKSVGLIRNSLGLIDMSPNTVSRPHDRFVRACGAHTFCLTNEQQFLEELPNREHLSFSFDKESIQQRVAAALDHRAATVDMGIEVAEAYRKKHPSEELIVQMLKYASLAKLDNLRQRPHGSQDFFVWPPSSLQ